LILINVFSSYAENCAAVAKYIVGYAPISNFSQRSGLSGQSIRATAIRGGVSPREAMAVAISANVG
jgi:hypothetical protein